MHRIVEIFLGDMAAFFIVYLMVYTTFLFLAVVVGAFQLYERERRIQIQNELKHDYYMPISILVPAHNEEVTIVDSIISLLDLKYRLFEIVIVDDGSTDKTSESVIDFFDMKQVNRPVHRLINCKPVKGIYESIAGGINITLIVKENGGKGDALNMGINMAQYPYFLCMDADSILQQDSLEKIVQPLLEDENIVAIGGLIHVEQCAERTRGNITAYHMPLNPIIAMQAVEYDRSFLASRILMDEYNGNLIISGAFGLFKKDVVIAAGGYDSGTLGEDMELVVKLHTFCRNNNIPYSIRYEPNAVCWSQVPEHLRDLLRQRRRWYLGMFQCMTKYAQIFLNPRFGLVSILSYMYYLLFELLAPVIELLGIITTATATILGVLNWNFMLQFMLLYGIYGAVLTMTAFFQRIYSHGLTISPSDVMKAIAMCLLESIFFRYVLSIGRMFAFAGYRKNKRNWGSIRRAKIKE